MLRKTMVSWMASALVVGCGGGGGGGGGGDATAPPSFSYAAADTVAKASGADVPVAIVKRGSGPLSWTLDGLGGAPWLTVAGATSGNDSANIRVIVAENPGAPRSASLTLSGSDGSRATFTIEQTAARSSRALPTWDDGNPGWTFAYEDFLSANRPYSATTAAGATDVRRYGYQSQRFEVRPGDCGGTDCARADGKRERSEFGQTGTLDGQGAMAWYGWSLFVPDDFQDAGNVAGTSRTLTAGQFQQSPSFVPAFQFGKEVNGDFIVRTFTTDAGSAPKLRFVVIPARDFAGHWHDFVAQVLWSAASDGYFRLWVNGKQVVDYAGQTMISGNTGIFFKYGVYRIASPTENHASVLYFDELRRGASRSAVDIRALERP